MVFSSFFAIFASIMAAVCGCCKGMDSKESDKRNISAGNYGRVIKYLGIFGGAQGVSVLLGMLRNKAASVLLGTVGFGLIALYSRTVQLFCDTTGLSLSLSAVRRMADVYSNEGREAVSHCVKVVRSIALLTGLVGMVLMLLCSPLLSQWMFEGDAACTLRLMLVSPVVLFMAYRLYYNYSLPKYTMLVGNAIQYGRLHA